MKKTVVLLSLCLFVGVRAQAQQKGGEALMNLPKKSHVVKSSDAETPASQAMPSNVFSYQKTGQSHIKSLGQIGKTARYEIVSIKVRGLDTPNVSAFLIYDSTTDTLVGGQSAGAPGLGVAIVNGAAQVGGNFLFGANLRPDNLSNNNVSAAIAQSESESRSDSDSQSHSQSNTTVNNPPAPKDHGHKPGKH